MSNILSRTHLGGVVAATLVAMSLSVPALADTGYCKQSFTQGVGSHTQGVALATALAWQAWYNKAVSSYGLNWASVSHAVNKSVNCIPTGSTGQPLCVVKARPCLHNPQ